MAIFECVKSVNLPAGEDLTSSFVGAALTVDSNGRVVRSDAATELIVGVLGEVPKASAVGTNVPVVLIAGGGIIKMRVNSTTSAAVAAGQLIVPSTVAGYIDDVANIGALAADQMAVGVALEAGAASEYIRVLAGAVAAPHSA